jgi:hypothetical protein
LSLVVVSKLVIHSCSCLGAGWFWKTNIGAGSHHWTLPWTALFGAGNRHDFRMSDRCISVNCYGENCFTVHCVILRCFLQAYNAILNTLRTSHFSSIFIINL